MCFERSDIPKRMLSLALGVAILAHFGAAKEATYVVIAALFFEALGRVLRIKAPRSVDDYSPLLIAMVFLRIIGSVTSFSALAILLIAQPHQMSLVIGLLFFSGVAIHALTSQALMTALNWLQVVVLTLSFAVIALIIPGQTYAPPGPDDLWAFHLATAIWVVNIVTSVFRQNSTRTSYADAISMAKDRARQLAYLARHDALTGLLNRHAFDEVLLDAIQFAAPEKRIAVLVIDLDKFKPINDRLGHAAGDATLVEVAARIRTAIGNGQAARLGGDEFAALLPSANERGIVERLALRLKRALGEPIAYGDETITISASIGVAFGDTRDDDPSSICARADQAMYVAKSEYCDYPVFADDLRPTG